MEVPIINRLNDFQMGLNSLQHPSLLSQITSSISGIQSVSIAYSFCKWGAVILALVATFGIGSIINRVKILIVRFSRDGPSLPAIPLLSQLDDDDYSSSDDDDDDGTSSTPSSLSSEFEEDRDETTPSSSSFNWRTVDGDFRVRGAGHQVDDQLQSGNVRLRRRYSIGDIFSLLEIANSNSVVKLWDSIGFGLGLDFDDYDYEFPAGRLAQGTTSSSPAVVVSAEKNASGKTALKIWDTRLRRGVPAVIAEWGPSLGKIVGVGFGEVEKFYVRDDARDDVTVGDIRKVSSPLENVTKSDVDTFWDADAVIVSAEN